MYVNDHMYQRDFHIEETLIELNFAGLCWILFQS